MGEEAGSLMNVLFLTSTLPRSPEDQQAPFVLQQAAAWKAKRPSDAVHILAPHDAGVPRKEAIGDITVHRFRYLVPERLQALAYPAIVPNIRRNPLLVLEVPPFLWAEYQAARGLVHRHDIDLVYAHWVMPQGFTAWQLRRALGVPYVLQNHSSDLKVFSAFGGLGRVLARSIVREAASMFCVNQRQKEDALALFPPHERDVLSHKIGVLPMGVDAEFAVTEAGSASAHQYDLGAICRLSRKKGLHHLLAALRYMEQTVSLGIAGDGEEMMRLKTGAAGLPVTFTGFLSGSDKMAFFAATHFMVFPSLASGGDVEGLPVALLEALIGGKVVIASRDTNITALPEWPLIREDVFLLDDPSDHGAFARLIGQMLRLSPSEVAARSARLRAAMSRYFWPRLIEEYFEAIRLTGQPLA